MNRTISRAAARRFHVIGGEGNGRWMRWKTYNRYEEKFEQYEDILDFGTAELVAKLGGPNFF